MNTTELKAFVEEQVGEAYNIGHAHGLNVYRMYSKDKPCRVREGWGKYARNILKAVRKHAKPHPRLRR